MGYGEIIKRAWKITWRYRMLWVLGLFAGISGASGGGGGGGNSNLGSLGSNSSSGSGHAASGLDGAAFLRGFERFLPLIIVATLGLVVLSIVWWILGVAARGGLVYAVNEIEEGRPTTLGSAWNAGFSRFWGIFGLSVLLALPVLALLTVILIVTIVPILLPVIRGGTPSIGAVVPVCGTLVIGLPLLIVLSVVLGLLHELALRYMMLAGHGVFEGVGESWRVFRRRFKDTALMYLVGWGLNIAAGLVIAIPMVIVVVAVIVPGVIAAIAGKWAAFAGVVGVAVLLMMLLSFAFTAVWGTFTSALWTIFFRRLTGMEVPHSAVVPPVAAPPASADVVAPPDAPGPPPPPAVTEPYTPPPMAPGAPGAPPTDGAPLPTADTLPADPESAL